jgi:hypothetical protein
MTFYLPVTMETFERTDHLRLTFCFREVDELVNAAYDVLVEKNKELLDARARGITTIHPPVSQEPHQKYFLYRTSREGRWGRESNRPRNDSLPDELKRKHV